ncbi:amino acid adenylation domain-containing protein [Anaerotruncus colihominis]|uniref:amino acid adenylation domain-containing protein n=1 Tax=Anaerotruncus colihominis TaxID=169435 RepID=UPI003515378C
MIVLERLKHYAKTDRIALVCREDKLSYRELDARSDAFAAWLLDTFGDDRSPVVLCGDKETGLLPCIFGALKAGRAYVPIDSVVPDDRAAQIMADVNPKAVVDFTGRKLDCGAKVLALADLEAIFSTPEEISSENYIPGNAPAYILFTAGSTGRPKGVPITAGNLDAFCRGLLPFYPEGSVVLHQVSYSFDVSGCAVYAGISQGMTLFTVDHAMVANLQECFAALEKSKLTLWVSTPSFAELCVQSERFGAGLLPQLRQFLFCGEVLTHTLCDTLSQRFPAAKILNTYGPTEATVLVTTAEITEEMRRDSRPIPIGKAIDGVTLRLEQDGNEVTVDGQTGELLILGPTVGPGYFGRPDLTEKSFFTDQKTGLRGYRTGDLCYQKEGSFYYCGRADNQLKLHGYRIELEDIEANLQKLPNVQRAAVVPIRDADGKAQYLAAFLLLAEPDGLAPLKRAIALKRQAAEFLPAYMIPRKLMAVDAFPLNVNGKIDRKALAARLEGTP